MKYLTLLLLLPLLACEVADHDHPLHTEGAFIVEIDPPVSVLYITKDDDHIMSQLYEAFKGIPPRAIHLETGDWRTVTVTFSSPPQRLSVYHSTTTDGESNLFRGHRLDGTKLYIDIYCPQELSQMETDVSPYGKIHIVWQSGSQILRTWCNSIRR